MSMREQFGKRWSAATPLALLLAAGCTCGVRVTAAPVEGPALPAPDAGAGCGPQSCATCCAGDLCVPATSGARCGVGGVACAACDTGAGETCQDGVCAGGAGECPEAADQGTYRVIRVTGPCPRAVELDRTVAVWAGHWQGQCSLDFLAVSAIAPIEGRAELLGDGTWSGRLGLGEGGGDCSGTFNAASPTIAATCAVGEGTCEVVLERASCGPDNCTTCCLGDVCVARSSAGACGGGGEACAACDPARGDECIDGACVLTGWCAAEGCGPKGLLSVHPPIANAGDRIWLEGFFGLSPPGDITVHFPGGVAVPSAAPGPTRLEVAVPEGATAGDLTVAVNGATIDGKVPFRRATFPLGLEPFRSRYDQADAARPPPRLVTDRSGHTVAVVGGYLYVIGGHYHVASVERARINADGTLGPFSTVPGVALTTPRGGHTSVVIGPWLYVIGGAKEGSVLGSVERAPITADGSLGPFSTLPNVRLTTPRYSHASEVIGHYLYVVGGYSPALATVERAFVHPDGTLGAFADAGVALREAREHPATAVIGSFLYVMGGGDFQKSVERAAIRGEGELGPFEDAGVELESYFRPTSATVLGSHLYVVRGCTKCSNVEAAPIGADGTLGAFTPFSGATLAWDRHDPATAVIGNYLYVVGGGRPENAAELGLGSVARASINAGGSLGPFALVEGVEMRAPRRNHASAVIGDSLYVIAGHADGSVERASIAPDGALGPFSTVPGATANAGPFGATSAVLGESLHVAGGQIGGDFMTSDLERSRVGPDLVPGPFTTVDHLLRPRAYHVSAVAGDRLYVLGGWVPGGLGSGAVESASIGPDGTLGPFAELAGVTLARRSAAIALAGSNLYVVGGADDLGLLRSVARAETRWDGSLGPFSTVEGVALGTARFGHTCAVVGSYLYVIGGMTSGGAALSSIERAPIDSHGALGPFETWGPGLATARAGHRSLVAGNYLYVFGGSGLTSVERAVLR